MAPLETWFPRPGGLLRPGNPQPFAERLTLIAMLLFIALVALNPEARIVFAVIDAIGIDVFVLLLTLQLRSAWAQVVHGSDAFMQGWYRHLWLPGYRLSLPNVRLNPAIAVYAVVGHCAGLLGMLLVFAALHRSLTSL